MAFTYEMRADVPRNRLYMRLIGFMTEADARKVVDALIAEYDKLKPGFVIINDIRELKPTTQAATEQMRRAQEAAVQRGFGRAIRVIGDQVITHMQWSRTLKARPWARSRDRFDPGGGRANAGGRRPVLDRAAAGPPARVSARRLAR